MPFGDGTGPLGLGAMTGRAAGYCAGYGVPGYANPYIGVGFGRGIGFGRGFGRRWFWRRAALYGYPLPYGTVPPAIDPYAVWRVSPEEEKNLLLEHTKMLEEQLAEMKKRIAELEKEAK
ncbi:MAG TPA: DUF5320 domain-containing protein [bacterium]|nr:DUF5320 domain-containing protein [bacterium]HPP29603.1 DUF5320 domain-containing protein [bacterium]